MIALIIHVRVTNYVECSALHKYKYEPALTSKYDWENNGCVSIVASAFQLCTSQPVRYGTLGPHSSGLAPIQAFPGVSNALDLLFAKEMLTYVTVGWLSSGQEP